MQSQPIRTLRECVAAVSGGRQDEEEDDEEKEVVMDVAQRNVGRFSSAARCQLNKASFLYVREGSLR